MMNKIVCDEVTIDSPYFIYWENSYVKSRVCSLVNLSSQFP